MNCKLLVNSRVCKILFRNEVYLKDNTFFGKDSTQEKFLSWVLLKKSCFPRTKNYWVESFWKKKLSKVRTQLIYWHLEKLMELSQCDDIYTKMIVVLRWSQICKKVEKDSSWVESFPKKTAEYDYDLTLTLSKRVRLLLLQCQWPYSLRHNQ